MFLLVRTDQEGGRGVSRAPSQEEEGCSRGEEDEELSGLGASGIVLGCEPVAGTLWVLNASATMVLRWGAAPGWKTVAYSTSNYLLQIMINAPKMG